MAQDILPIGGSANVHHQGKTEVPKKKDADFIYIDYTRSVCPECLAAVDAQILVRDGKVFMQKRCPAHGAFEALIYSDAAMYMAAQQYNKPGTVPLSFASDVSKGCHDDCGLCPNHKQHTCLALMEITDRCDMLCPVCFTSATKDGPFVLSLEKAEKMLDLYCRCEGNPEVIQISGGEPTTHPKLFEIIQMAQAKGIGLVMLNTNGIRISKDEDFVKRLADLGVVVYFQFDGLKPETYVRMRGRDYSGMKMRALDSMVKHGLSISMVATVAKGVNDHEIGDIFRLGLQTPGVGKIVYQPMGYVGRVSNLLKFDPLDRLTIPDVLKALEVQTDRLLHVDDFIPVPCPHPTCSSTTYLVRKGDTFLPITRHFNARDYLNYFQNCMRPDLSPVLQKSLESMWSASADTARKETIEGIRQVVSCCGDFKTAEAKGEIKSVLLHSFMDRYTFDYRRAMKCCVHSLLADEKLVPLCVHNVIRQHALPNL